MSCQYGLHKFTAANSTDVHFFIDAFIQEKSEMLLVAVIF